MSTRRSGTSRKPKQSDKTSARLVLDPYFACLIFGAVGLGTLKLSASPRLVILWTTLIGLWVVYREGQTLQIQYHFKDLGRGAAIGAGIGVPLVLLAFRPLATAIPILYVSVDPASLVGLSGTMIFVSLVLVAPLAEELFFRDVLHKERGFWVSIGLYAAAGLILFLPTAGGFPVVLLAVSGATAVLGILYAFLYERYGLSTSLACHAILNFLLLFVPALVSYFEWLTQGVG